MGPSSASQRPMGPSLLEAMGQGTILLRRSGNGYSWPNVPGQVARRPGPTTCAAKWADQQCRPKIGSGDLGPGQMGARQTVPRQMRRVRSKHFITVIVVRYYQHWSCLTVIHSAPPHPNTATNVGTNVDSSFVSREQIWVARGELRGVCGGSIQHTPDLPTSRETPRSQYVPRYCSILLTRSGPLACV